MARDLAESRTGPLIQASRKGRVNELKAHEKSQAVFLFLLVNCCTERWTRASFSDSVMALRKLLYSQPKISRKAHTHTHKGRPAG